MCMSSVLGPFVYMKTPEQQGTHDSVYKLSVSRFVLGFVGFFPESRTACAGMAAEDLSLLVLNLLCKDILATHLTVPEHPWDHKILAFGVKQQEMQLALNNRL